MWFYFSQYSSTDVRDYLISTVEHDVNFEEIDLMYEQKNLNHKLIFPCGDKHTKIIKDFHAFSHFKENKSIAH